MKPPPFDLVVAESWDEALAATAEAGADAQVLAGGQSLMAMLNMRLARPEVLVDINRIPGADAIEVADGGIRIGATARQRTLELRPGTADHLPLVAEALPHVGHVQTRARGTVCGSLCHADPSAELPLCLLALEGSVELAGRRTRRTVAAEDFFAGVLTTARREDEIAVAARYPAARPGHGYAFAEISERHGDFALAAFAAVAGPGFVRLAVGAAADRPVARTWREIGTDALADALNDFAWDLGCHDDAHATARYRRDMVRRVGLRTIETALVRATAA